MNFSGGRYLMEYIIKKGDSLWSIAKKTLGRGLRWDEIAAANNLTQNSLILPGQKIIIPDKNDRIKESEPDQNREEYEITATPVKDYEQWPEEAKQDFANVVAEGDTQGYYQHYADAINTLNNQPVIGLQYTALQSEASPETDYISRPWEIWYGDQPEGTIQDWAGDPNSQFTAGPYLINRVYNFGATQNKQYDDAGWNVPGRTITSEYQRLDGPMYVDQTIYEDEGSIPKNEKRSTTERIDTSKAKKRKK